MWLLTIMKLMLRDFIVLKKGENRSDKSYWNKTDFFVMEEFWYCLEYISCRAACKDLLDPLSAHISIEYRSWQVFRDTPCNSTELLLIGYSWLSNLCLCMGIGPTTTIGLMARVFARGSGDRGSIPGRITPKIEKNATWRHYA